MDPVNLNDLEMTELGHVANNLFQRNLITDIERRIIVATIRLQERREAVYTVIMSQKEHKHAVVIMNEFRIALNVQLAAEAAGIEDIIAGFYPVRELEDDPPNPLLNEVVLKRLFGFLPLDDIKQCRLVNRKWTTAADPVLRRRSTILFNSFEMHPIRFAFTFKNDSSTSTFTSFHIQPFRENLRVCTGWQIIELEMFFEYWKEKIRKLKLNQISLADTANCTVNLQTFNLADWTPPNLTELKINSSNGTTFEVHAKQLMTVERLSLVGCTLIVADPAVRIRPRQLIFEAVKVQREIPPNENHISLNRIFNFEYVTHMNIVIPILYSLTFHLDMAAQIFDTECLNLVYVQLENWQHASGRVNFFYLRGSSFVTRNNLKIKQFCCNLCELDLSVLPETIEKMHLIPLHDDISCSEPIQLPNLKYLNCIFYNSNLHLLSHFANCENLVELDLDGRGTQGPLILNARFLPRAVKKLKISGLQLDVAQDGNIRYLDTLVLEDFLPFLFPQVVHIVSVIKAKNLVITWWGLMKLYTTHIADFVVAEQDAQKIIVGAINGVNLHLDNPFDKSVLSRFVANRQVANSYIFENEVGRSLSSEEFEEWRRMNELDERFYPSAVGLDFE